MMAIAAAVAFGLALLLDLTDATLGDTITAGTLVTLGFLLIALHLAGVGTGSRSFRFRRRARR
ncbi:hypothetical protein NBRGN_015_00020 [Nocardia brasiliensis NBRC 14402]|uniref:hypothetical protein n=1 Tax=Nocardia brasiliensis TaxID=37326 RepID=UPI00045D3DD3|nr:hypothetical protein [Nocardia brasiliensis]ASF07423.1 hypothetical protein CEQ30_08670 [Nocardia brasiliensis]GAJ79501.1 hypothetical protein NBRGN_015_00020 [Nocardia brasiliensis NBRC 14402]SUB55656.1 Uncharacterised protein [Nocardia brasiliensis]